MIRLSKEELEGIALRLCMQSVQSFDRKTVWLLMRHIEAQDIEIEATNRAADRLQDKVIDLLRKKRKTFWQRIFRKG